MNRLFLCTNFIAAKYLLSKYLTCINIILHKLLRFYVCLIEHFSSHLTLANSNKIKMKTKFSSILTLLLVFVVQIIFAQEQTITGTVTDEDGLPLPGVTVIIKGTTTGVQTDFDGNYAIDASQGDLLIFSFIGLQTAEYTVGSNDVIDVTMATDTAQLDEVVVTALGISREKKSLGYAAEEVAGDELAESRNSNAVSSLSGRVAGVTISAPSGNLGGSSRILLRGAGSITQDNKLYL